MAVNSAMMNGLVYEGNVNLPVAGGGTVEMMEFKVDSMSMSGATTTIIEQGVTATETDSAFSASGVTLYTTHLSGSLGGVLPVSFTPSTLTVANLLQLPSSTLDVLNILTSGITTPMTGVTADQAVIIAGTATKTTIGVSD